MNYNIILSIFIILIILLIITKVVTVFTKVNMIKQATSFTLQNDIFCEQFKTPCDIVVDDKLTLPTDFTDYNKSTALFCIDMISRIINIYRQNKVGKLELHKDLTIVKELKIDDENPIFGYMATNNTTLYIVFRGSLNSFEYQQDLMYTEKLNHHFESKENVYIHSGFSNIYDKIDSVIMDNISDNITQVVVCGHSLGAAIATLCAYELSLTKEIPICLYTFASPRVGNIEFANDFDNQDSITNFRIVNVSDIIPTLPTAIMPNFKNINEPIFYKHVGELISFDNNYKSVEHNHMIYNYRDGVSNLII